MTRRRWVYTQGGQPLPGPIEVSSDWSADPKRCDVVTDLYMDGVRTVEGVDIGSRRKRREYMRANGLADSSDFKGEWQKAAKQREAIRTGTDNDPSRREAIGRAIYEQSKRGRR